MSELTIAINNNTLPVFKLCLKIGCLNVNAIIDGVTPLFLCAKLGRTQMVALLLKTPEIDVNLVTTSEEITPLQIAIENEQVPVVELLLQHTSIDVNKKTKFNSTPLCTAIIKKNYQITELLLKQLDIKVNNYATMNSLTPLYLAIESCNIEIVKLLLGHPKINVNKLSGFHILPLHLAVKNNYIDIVKLLLAHRDIEINKIQYNEKTALFVAAEEGNVACVELLFGLQYINQNIPNSHGNTPLIIAAKNGHIECVKILLIDDVSNKIAMNPDTRAQYITSMLCCRKDTETKVPQIPNLAIKMIFGFFQQKTLIDAQNNKGQTALFWAAANGQQKIVNSLLYHNCNKSIAAEDGITPLQIAAQCDHQACVRQLQKTYDQIKKEYENPAM